MFRFLILLVVLGVIGVGVAEWANEIWSQPGSAKRETVVLIAPGSRSHDIAAQLQSVGAVGNGLLFEAELHLHGAASNVKAGEYALPAFASMSDVSRILVEGKSIQHKLTAAEGLTSDMIHKLVMADPVLVKDAGPVPAEGTLLPETYLFTRGTSRAEIVGRMESAEKKFLNEQWAKRTQGLPLTTSEQAMVLASIVEKETALPAERRHIAAVFVNRLKAGMKLQSDPTIIYGITKGYPLGRGIRESELQADTPYNTYAITGLPPTPICNPGKDSIAAVLNPAASLDLYFVANGKGGHVFASTMAQHERNVVAWRAVERARQGLPPVEVAKPAKVKAAAKPAVKSVRRRRRAG
ncbi:MAG: endolytic transglycosylase MltG [Rhizomicrobium sp.]